MSIMEDGECYTGKEPFPSHSQIQSIVLREHSNVDQSNVKANNRLDATCICRMRLR